MRAPRVVTVREFRKRTNRVVRETMRFVRSMRDGDPVNDEAVAMVVRVLSHLRRIC
jgi:hypothetical protein